jgi:formyl-CoA transferase
MGHVIAVPAAGATLADWGAEVTKVEPLTGDMARGVRRLLGVKVADDDVNWYFQLLNRNKKGLAVNLKTEPGREILYKLVGEADVFMSNYQFDTLKKLEVDYAVLSQFNPRLIYALLTGYGTVGPEKGERGFDYAAAWARTGGMYMMGEPGSIPPPQRGGMMDRVAGANMVGGIMAALFHREKTGQGQNIEISLYHTGVWTLSDDIQTALFGGQLRKHDRTRAYNPLWNHYRTKDKRWFWLAMLQPDLSWSDFCRAIGKPELESDRRFNSIEARGRNRRKLITIIDDVIATKTLVQWEHIFRKNNIIFGRVASPKEVIRDPQANVNELFVRLNHSANEEMKTVATPVSFQQNPASIRSPAPELGQHTEEILLNLGYNWEDITQLKDKGVIL